MISLFWWKLVVCYSKENIYQFFYLFFGNALSIIFIFHWHWSASKNGEINLVVGLQRAIQKVRHKLARPWTSKSELIQKLSRPLWKMLDSHHGQSAQACWSWASEPERSRRFTVFIKLFPLSIGDQASQERLQSWNGSVWR